MGAWLRKLWLRLSQVFDGEVLAILVADEKYERYTAAGGEALGHPEGVPGDEILP